MDSAGASGAGGAGERAASLPSDLPDEFATGAASPGEELADTGSLRSDLDALIADGRTYLEAELAYQKSRAGYAANRLKWTAIYGAAAFAFLHLALIGLTVGAVFALAPLVGPWLATAIVVVALIAGAAAFALNLRGKLADIRSAFEDDGA